MPETEIIVTPIAMKDLAGLPRNVEDTFLSKKESAEFNMDLHQHGFRS